jgi:FAD/FMN-containing dehydrogenase
VVRPASTEECARVVALCAEQRVPIVPQGGNTGLVGGGVPHGGIVLSTARMKAIRMIDAANRTMTV